jgi:hypothetical protein
MPGYENQRSWCQEAWDRHVASECILTDLESTASWMKNHDGKITHIVIPISFWESVKEQIQQADDLWVAVQSLK